MPPALTGDGRVLLLQPRRVAARAVARRIAEERGWRTGVEVGWQIRFERHFSADTRLLVVTEGILTARLQQDPLLSDVGTIVVDEFHERSIHADLGLALARQAWLARDDLRIVVMSATLDVERVASFLDGCPVINVPGALHPLAQEYAPGEPLVNAVRAVMPRTAGNVLCFLPGAREIARAQGELAGGLGADGADVLPLHGSLEADAQDLVMRPSAVRRVILSTNIAETSVTVPGVSAVIDTGLVKVARYDVARGVDSLTTERVTQDSADQRAGRAARLGPGVVRRLWDARDRLRPHREPEIMRVDLSGPLLELLAWGGNPYTFEWFEAPPADRVAAAIDLLAQLGALAAAGAPVSRGSRISPGAAPTLTPLGRRLQRVPLHPRVARILLDAGGSNEAAAACALLSDPLAAGRAADTPPTTTCDLLPLIDRFERQPFHTRQLARELQRIATAEGGAQAEAASHARRGLSDAPDLRLRHALFTGYADRLARRRGGSADRYTLASGHGASLARESGVRDAEYLVALDIVAAERSGASEARIRAASRVERDWIEPASTEVEHRVDPDTGRVRARRVARYGSIVVAETDVAPDPAVAAPLLRDAWLARPHDEATTQLLRRLEFAGLEVDVTALAQQAAMSVRSVGEIDVASQLPYHVARALAEGAPLTLTVPSGRAMRLEYAADGTVSASVKLQELFGLAATPGIGPKRVPVTFHLLAPNGRPVQTTRDLRSFWERTYPEVRKELRGRYPKHPWPDDPWTATPTHRTTRRT